MIFHVASVTRFLDLCGCFVVHSGRFDFALGATLWSVKHTGLLRNMFFDGFTDGNKVRLILRTSWLVYFMFSSPQFLLWVIMVSFLQVVSIKAIGIAIKLTLEGTNQLIYAETWFFMTVGAICVITQLNYLNKVCIFFYCMFFNPCFFLFPSFSMFLMRGGFCFSVYFGSFFLSNVGDVYLGKKVIVYGEDMVYSIYCITSLAFPWVSLFSKRTFQWRYIFWFTPLCIINVILF